MNEWILARQLITQKQSDFLQPNRIDPDCKSMQTRYKQTQNAVPSKVKEKSKKNRKTIKTKSQVILVSRKSK